MEILKNYIYDNPETKTEIQSILFKVLLKNYWGCRVVIINKFTCIVYTINNLFYFNQLSFFWTNREKQARTKNC